MTETVKHTPGPWFWALDHNNQPTSLQRSGAGDWVISPQVELGDYGLSVHPWNDVSEADACLIEAAPDLLEALIACLKTLADFKVSGPCVVAGNAAIAKVAGRAALEQGDG